MRTTGREDSVLLTRCCCWVAHLCLTLCDPMDCSLPGSAVHGLPRQEYWSGLPFPPPGDLPDPGIEPMSSALAGGFVTTEQSPFKATECFCFGSKWHQGLWRGCVEGQVRAQLCLMYPSHELLFLKHSFAECVCPHRKTLAGRYWTWAMKLWTLSYSHFSSFFPK